MEVKNIKLNLNYLIKDINERKKIVEEIVSTQKLSNYQLESLSTYLVTLKETTDKSILTDNRLSTINKRETSFEGIVSKLETNEDGIYSLIRQDKSARLINTNPITKTDLSSIPFLQEIQNDIDQLKTLIYKDYITQQAIIEMAKTQHLIREAYKKPIPKKNIPSAAPPDSPLWEQISLSDEKHVSALLQYYSQLKTKYSDNTSSIVYWILTDLENAIESSEIGNEAYKTILYLKLDNHSNEEIRQHLLQTQNKKYSDSQISIIFSQRIPKIIADSQKKIETIHHYTFNEIGTWKLCRKCNTIKLQHPLFFSKNSNSQGFYSICRSCRSSKK